MKNSSSSKQILAEIRKKNVIRSVKVTVIGKKGSGKSYLINSCCPGREPISTPDVMQMTFTGIKNINNTKYNIGFIELTDDSFFDKLTKELVLETECLLLVVDYDKKNVHSVLERYFNSLKHSCKEVARKIVVFNKV